MNGGTIVANQVQTLKCVCGSTAEARELDGRHFVRCKRVGCWMGPERKTKAGAVKVWRKSMLKGRSNE